MQTNYRLWLALLASVICLTLIIACEKKSETTIVQSGLEVEAFESDKLNVLPIIGYMQTGSVLPPVIDGNAEDVIWTLTEPYEVVTEGGPNGFGPTVTFKALYDNYNLFLLAIWEDTSKSVDKDVWWLGKHGQNDTTFVEPIPDYEWNQISEPFSGYVRILAKIKIDTTVAPPDTQYVYAYEKKFFSGNEDGFAIMWNINSTNFLGCTSLCHGPSMAADVDETADVWYWMAHKTNPKGYADDLSLQSTGFMGDSGDSCWIPNISDDLPQFMNQDEPGRNLTFLHDTLTTTNFYSTLSWKGSDRVPGYLLQLPSGSRSNVHVVASHNGNKWTLEMKRRLDSGDVTSADVQFNPDTEANVDFHVVVYDNQDSGNHAHSTGTHVLHFLQYNE